MSLLSRFAKRKAGDEAAVAELPAECGHWEVAPRWDCAADIGKKDRVVSYTCTSCGEHLTPEEAQAASAA